MSKIETTFEIIRRVSDSCAFRHDKPILAIESGEIVVGEILDPLTRALYIELESVYRHLLETGQDVLDLEYIIEHCTHDKRQLQDVATYHTLSQIVFEGLMREIPTVNTLTHYGVRSEWQVVMVDPNSDHVHVVRYLQVLIGAYTCGSIDAIRKFAERKEE